MSTPRGRDLAYYKTLYDSIEPSPRCIDQIAVEAKRILAGKVAYDAVEGVTNVPWIFHGAIHEMECDCNFQRQILNGQKWNRRTTIVPIGEGPWKSWVESTVFALNEKRAHDRTWVSLVGWNDWTIQRMCMEWERWNGGGYMKRGKHSPYLWAGCTHGANSGYYTSDGKYSPTAQSKQIGAAVLLWWLKSQRGTAAQGETNGTA